MLPVSRMSGDPYEIPKFTVGPEDLVSFAEELDGYHSQFADCFSRSEPRENFQRYMSGQLSKLERKSIEPIALRVEDGQVRAMQRFVSDVIWDERRILTKYRSMVALDLGCSEGVLVFDESAFPKKGNDSAGVARQYCGIAGKVDNCQVGVFVAYASPQGYALVDKRLYMPEQWFHADHKVLRKKCKVPPQLAFKTKPQLASDMLRGIRAEGSLPFRYVASDSVYGQNEDFLDAVEEDPNCFYCVAVASTTLCWLKEPVLVEQRYRYKKEPRTRMVLHDGQNKPITVQTLGKSINNYFWYRRIVSEGTKGPIAYEFTRKRIVICKQGRPQRNVWLLIRRTVAKEPDYTYFISNVPTESPLKLLIWLTGMRWPIEQAFEEAKTELGMDHYEVRKYPGWNHHILTCMLGHFFLWHIRIRLGKKSTRHYGVAA